MLFQPAIIALLMAAAIAVLMLGAATPFAVQVIRYWDIRSGSERQLDFERRTYLFSTLLTFVFVIQLAALLLFVFNADRLSAMFVGAMCAVGTLNVNDFGFPSLITQMVVFSSPPCGWRSTMSIPAHRITRWSRSNMACSFCCCR